jgi:hypothetical protein
MKDNGKEMFIPNRPLIYDYVELRLRLPVRRADDALFREIGIALPHSRQL